MNKVKLGDITNNFDKQRVPVSSKDREKLKKIYPYYGAQGIVDFIDDYIFDGEYLLVAEDGENLKSQNQNIVNFVKGKFWVNNHAHIIQANEKSDTKFLYYYLSCINVKPYITGSAQPKLTKENLNLIELNLPSLPTQIVIAHILSSLDDKIELNNKINAALENLARTVYEYWFVQNADKKWKKKKIGEIAEVIRGTMITSKQTKEGNIKVVAGGIDYSYCHSQFNREKNTITISGSGANAGFVNFWRERIFASDCTTVRGKNDIDTFLIFQHLKFNQENIFRLAKGSAQPHVYPSDIKDIWFYEIPQNIKDKFSSIFTAINEQIAKQLLENATLTYLRDFLLPLFMNGQVTVGKAQDEPTIIPFKKIADSDTKYQTWKEQIGLAARGNIDEKTLRNIYEAIDENDR